jgi:hypothetical protein
MEIASIRSAAERDSRGEWAITVAMTVGVVVALALLYLVA